MQEQIGKIFSKINDRLTLFRYIYPFIKKNRDRIIHPENTLCLFCQARGGSTWLAEIMLNIPNSVLIDEPLWRGKMVAPFFLPNYYDRKVESIADLQFFFNQPIPQSTVWPEAKKAFEEILSGRVVSIGLYDEQGLDNLRKSGLYITKFTYANLLLPWLSDQFNFNAILLTRHPCAVIASQLKMPAWENIDPSRAAKSMGFPYSDMYSNALSRIGKIDSREKYLALLWSLGFKNTAMHPYNGDRWLTISYEGLLMNFQEEIKRIDQRFTLGLENLAIDHKKPSKSTIDHSLSNLYNNEQLGSWTKELSSTQKTVILDVLEKLEIDIYSDALEPDFERLYSTQQVP